MLDYFQQVFASEQGEMEGVLRCVQPRVTDRHNWELTREVTKEEVWATVFDMFPDKAPGPDGMSPGFYQAYWDVLGSDIFLLC